MTKRLIAATAAVALCFVVGANQTEARGFHIRAGGVHVDVGNPHAYGHGHGYGRYSVGYPSYGYSGYGGGYGNVYRSYYGGGFGGGHGHVHSHWHDTSHYDWHGPSIVPHGNHYDYVPGHYDYHREGHWDHH